MCIRLSACVRVFQLSSELNNCPFADHDQISPSGIQWKAPDTKTVLSKGSQLAQASELRDRKREENMPSDEENKLWH